MWIALDRTEHEFMNLRTMRLCEDQAENNWINEVINYARTKKNLLGKCNGTNRDLQTEMLAFSSAHIWITYFTSSLHFSDLITSNIIKPLGSVAASVDLNESGKCAVDAGIKMLTRWRTRKILENDMLMNDKKQCCVAS